MTDPRKTRPPPQPRQGVQPKSYLRRTLLWGAVVLAAGLVTLGILTDDDDSDAVPVTLGPPRWVPPFLRYTLGGQERFMVLVRRTETETLPAGASRAPARGDRLEVRGYDAATLGPLFVSPVASIATNAAPSAGLLGEHAATIWIFADTIGAVSAVDGQVLIERQGLVALAPELAVLLAQPRLNINMTADGLMLQTTAAPLRFHPRTLRAAQLPATPEPLPTPRTPAAFDLRAPFAFRVTEARIGETWFGLPPANTPPVAGTRRPTIPGARFLAGGGVPAPGAQRLWRASLSPAPAIPPAAEAGFQSSGGARPTAAAAALTNTALRLDTPTPVAFEAAGQGQAGFLTQGPHPDSNVIRPLGAPGLLILHRAGESGLALTRINAQGARAWTATLPLVRIISALPGEGPLLLAGLDAAGTESLVTIALDTGAVVSRGLE